MALVSGLRLREEAAPRGPRVPLPWRSGRAWPGTVFMGTQPLLFYGALARLAAGYTRLGTGPARAGVLLALFRATRMVFASAMPVPAHRNGYLPLWTVGAVGLTPGRSPRLWASRLGPGTGGDLSLALTVVTAMAPTPREAAAYTGMAFLVGCTPAAVGPVTLGRLTDPPAGSGCRSWSWALSGSSPPSWVSPPPARRIDVRH